MMETVHRIYRFIINRTV